MFTSIFNAINTKKNSTQIAHLIERMQKNEKRYPNCTGMAFIGGVKDIKERNTKMMDTICHEGDTIEQAIAHAAEIIVDNGCTFNGQVIFARDVRSIEDITSLVWEKIYADGNGEIASKILECKKHMSVAGKYACAILYVDGIKRTDINTLNEEVFHHHQSWVFLMAQAQKMATTYNYDGRIYIIETSGEVTDVTRTIRYRMGK